MRVALENNRFSRWSNREWMVIKFSVRPLSELIYLHAAAATICVDVARTVRVGFDKCNYMIKRKENNAALANNRENNFKD